MHHHMYEQDGFGMMHAMMGAVSAVMFAALVAAVLYVLHRRGVLSGSRLAALVQRPTALPAGGRRSQPSDAEAYLDMALAKGEIDVAEYHERRSAIRSQH